MLPRVISVLEASTASLAEEWASLRPGGVRQAPAELRAALHAVVADLVSALREGRTYFAPHIEQRLRELGSRYHREGYDLQFALDEYSRFQGLLWRVLREHLREADAPLIELMQRLAQLTNHLLFAMLTAYTEAAAAALAQQAAVDTLTNVYTRGHILERLTAEVERAKRYEHPFCVLLIDVDGLKAVNDAFGHLAGDDALRRVAGILRSASRRSDAIGRYGGDEFLAILPETPASGAVILASRLVRQVIEARIPTIRDARFLSISIGIAQYPEAGGTPEEIIAAADQALYEAKARGGNALAWRHVNGALEVIHVPMPRPGEFEEAAPPPPEPTPAAPPPSPVSLEELEQAMVDLSAALEQFRRRLTDLRRLREQGPQAPEPPTNTGSGQGSPTDGPFLSQGPLGDVQVRLGARFAELRGHVLGLREQLSASEGLLQTLVRERPAAAPGGQEPPAARRPASAPGDGGRALDNHDAGHWRDGQRGVAADERSALRSSPPPRTPASDPAHETGPSSPRPVQASSGDPSSRADVEDTSPASRERASGGTGAGSSPSLEQLEEDLDRLHARLNELVERTLALQRQLEGQERGPSSP